MGAKGSTALLCANGSAGIETVEVVVAEDVSEKALNEAAEDGCEEAPAGGGAAVGAGNAAKDAEAFALGAGSTAEGADCGGSPNAATNPLANGGCC